MIVVLEVVAREDDGEGKSENLKDVGVEEGRGVEDDAVRDDMSKR